MTHHDPSAPSTHPDLPATEATGDRGAARSLRPRTPAPLLLLGFLALYLLAVCTPFGQRAENAVFGGHGAKPAWIYDWSGAAYGSSALPPLDQTAMPTLLVGTAALAAVVLVRRCWQRGWAALGVVVATLAGKELARMLLPRPDLVDARVSLVEASFPSGHVAIPAALALGAALVASPRLRPFLAAAGMVWLAVTAGAVQATYHHRPSDVLGSTLLACACYSLAHRLLPPAEAPGSRRRPRALAWVALPLSAAGALVAGARDDSLAQSLVFAAAALLCALLFWATTAQRPARRPRSTPG